MTVLVAVPVLGRPERAAPLAYSLADSVRVTPISLLFLCSPEDTAQIDACEALRLAAPDPRTETLESFGTGVVEWECGPGDWAKKINWAYELGTGGDFGDLAEWILTGADDLHFHAGWADAAMRTAFQTGARVIGTNDLGNPRVTKGSHATHNLVARSYADELGTIDGPGRVVAEVYDHNFVDDELVATAKYRREFAFSRDSKVEHLHPHWRKGEMDETYRKGLAGFDADRRIFLQRRTRMARGRVRR